MIKKHLSPHHFDSIPCFVNTEVGLTEGTVSMVHTERHLPTETFTLNLGKNLRWVAPCSGLCHNIPPASV